MIFGVLIPRRRRWRVSLAIIAVVFVPAIGGENLPDIRPALVGSGSNALVNLIDGQALMRNRVTHGAVFFRCFITPSGEARRCLAFGATPGSDPLRLFVQASLYRARFIPAVYNQRNTYAFFHGTVTFSVLNGKPHLRVYANQEKSELAEGKDFISPQPIIIPGHHYDETKYPESSWWSEERPVTVEIEMTVDVTGHLKDVHAVESVSGERFAEYAVYNIRTHTFLPAFRNGRPVHSRTHFTYVFIPSNWAWKGGDFDADLDQFR
jgi:hypothetical protein